MKMLDSRKVYRNLVLALGMFLIFSTLLTWVEASLPFIKDGANIIYEAKETRLISGPIFDQSAKNKIAIFGNSKTLSGFIPAEFDAHFPAGKVSSVNMGLPGSEKFISVLEQMIADGNMPTHVLLTMPWPRVPQRPDAWTKLRDNKAIASQLFPFRSLPRNLVLFSFHARHDGFAQTYRSNQAEAEQMIQDKGYYFIAGQSHFQNDTLPTDYRLPSDNPEQVWPREIDQHDWVLKRLKKLANEHHFDVTFVPVYYRIDEFAASDRGSNLQVVVAKHDWLDVKGPDYWLYPNRYFADPVHLNPTGASVWTEQLAELLKSEFVNAL